jgi:apolipoprotein N-acyltransferase
MDSSDTFSFQQKWGFAAATAVLWWAAGLPAAFFALGWVAFVPLFVMCSRLPPWQRFKWGYLTGWLSYFLINWWVILSITRGAPAIGASPVAGFFLGIVAVALIGVIQGVGVAIIALLWRRAMLTSPKVLLLWPFLLAAVWWGLEWLRAQSVLGHTWGALAYTQWSDLYSLQIVSVVGRNGLSAWCVWLAAMFALAWQWRTHHKKIYVAGGTLALGLVGVHLWGALLYYSPEGTGKLLKVLLVQTTAPSLSKRNEDNIAFEQAHKLTQKYFSKGSADLVVWPETTFRLGQGSAASMEDEAWVRRFCHDHQTSLLAGTEHWTADGHLFNEATLFAPDGNTQGNAKKWLVPFGERAPLGQYWPFLNRFAPQPALDPAPEKVPLDVKIGNQSIKLGTLICFESSFAAPFHLLHQRGAQLFAVLTNDDWFAGSEAPWAHATMSAVAAVENRTPVVQAANGGYSFAIDRKGRFDAESTFGSSQVLAVTVAAN